MKKAFFLLVFALMFSNSHAQNYKFSSDRVYYFKSSISETSFKNIRLRDGSRWRFNMPAMFSNYSRIFIIMDEYDREGIAYINNQAYKIYYLSGDFFYETGYITNVINKYKDGTRLMLEDYTEWDVENKKDIETVVNWNIPAQAILTESRESLIDPASQAKIQIKYAGRLGETE